jgi:hypothetical protein
MFDDEIWDEDRWEAFLRENDRRMDRRLQLFYRFSAEFPRPDDDDVIGLRVWYTRLSKYFEENGFGADDGFVRLFDPSQEVAEPEWLAEFGMEEDLEDDPVEDLALYHDAVAFASEVIRWSNTLSASRKDSTLVHFCACVTQIPPNLAKGHALGHEQDMLGGNIACTKRALNAANEGLDHLRDLKTSGHMNADQYSSMYENLFELRNAVALHVLDLRSRFDLGID